MTRRRPSDTHQPSHHPSARKQKQKKNCSAAVFTQPGFWLTPDGTILQVTSSHVAYVIDHPETFGFTRDELIAIYGQHHERLKLEGIGLHQTEEITATSAVNAACQTG